MGTAALRPTLAYKNTGYCRRISEAVGKNSFGLKVRSVREFWHGGTIHHKARGNIDVPD